MKPFYLTLLLISAAFALPAPFHFEPNQGQWEGEFAYRCDVGNASYFLTATGMTIAVTENQKRETRNEKEDRPLVEDTAWTVRGHAVMVRLVGASPNFELVPEDKLVSYSNYFKGRDQSQWKSRVPNYGTVVAKEVWPGIDVEYKADPRGVETLFHVKPGADVSQIVVQYYGLDAPLQVDDNGNLVLVTLVGNLYEKAPFAYQIENRKQANIPVRYQLLGNNRCGLVCEKYNRSAELVIDPLVYSTFFAGDGTDKVSDFTMDTHGNKIACGWVHDMRPDFPVTPGAFQTTRIGNPGWVAKLIPGADSILWATYVSGARGGFGGYIVVDTSDCIYYINQASARYWPITADAFDTTESNGDAGIVRLSPDGTSLQFGSFLGGDGQDTPYGAKLDSLGRLIIYGSANPPTLGFPISPNALFPGASFGAGFLSIFEPTSSELAYSTFIFPRPFYTQYFTEISDIGFVSESRVWICGGIDSSTIITTPDALQPISPNEPNGLSFFSLLDLQAAQIVYSSLFYGPEPTEQINRLRRLHAVDENRILLCGYTNEPDIPMPPGGFQSEYSGATALFLIEIERPQTLVRGTFFGGSEDGMTEPRKMHVAPDGSVVVIGETSSTDLPITSDAFDSTLAGNSDAFVARFSADLSELLYSTYIGGVDVEHPKALVYESGERVWIAGETESWDYPITPDALFPWDAGGFITCLTVPGEHNTITDPFIPHPSSFTLSTYPNPFNPTATLSFTLPQSAPVTVSVFNVLGQTVYEENLGRLNAGEHRHLFDASELPSGVYLARVQAGERSQIRKMVLLK